MKSWFIRAGIACFTLFALALSARGQTSSGTPAGHDEQGSGLFSRSGLRECLFVLEDDKYVIRTIYHNKGELSEVRVVPKYFFQATHSDWVEPESPVVMTPDAFKSLLNRIESAKPLGNLLKEGQIGTSFNLRMSFRDLYERGVVEREMFRVSPEKVYDVSSFRVVYFRQVSGKIEDMEGPGPDRGYRVKVNGKWYWTTEQSFKQIRLGEQGQIEAAGPISE